MIDEPAVEANSRHQAYLAFLVGPSIGTPKSTVIFAIDGFEAKLWGRRDDQDAEHNDDDDNDEDDSEEDDGDEEDNEEDDEEEESDDSSGEDSSQFQEGEEDPAPPPSRVPVVHYYSTDEGQAIKAADRLLSRTLMQKEADGSGMASEMCEYPIYYLERSYTAFYSFFPFSYSFFLFLSSYAPFIPLLSCSLFPPVISLSILIASSVLSEINPS